MDVLVTVSGVLLRGLCGARRRTVLSGICGQRWRWMCFARRLRANW